MSDISVRKGVAQVGEFVAEPVEVATILDANESNYPMPQEVAIILDRCLKQFPFNRYPPLNAELLIEVIAKELDLTNENIKIGNGSSDLLEKACYVFGGNKKRIAIPSPSFSMYDEYAVLSESEILHYPLTKEGFIDAEQVINFCKEKQVSLLIICNPNNPTGNYNSLPVIEKIISQVNCPVLVDEAYMEFADGKDVSPYDMRALNKLWLVAGSALSLVNNYTNVIVLRTFSKAYGLAGLRCGYAVGSRGLMRIFSKAFLPYHVNAFSLVAAKAVYENKVLYKEQIKEIREERDKLAHCFSQLGFFVYPSATNFLLLKAEGDLQQRLAKAYCETNKSVEEQEVASGLMLWQYLLDNGILVADFTKDDGLLGCIRITVGTPEENKQVLDKIVELFYKIQ